MRPIVYFVMSGTSVCWRGDGKFRQQLFTFSGDGALENRPPISPGSEQHTNLFNVAGTFVTEGDCLGAVIPIFCPTRVAGTS